MTSLGPEKRWGCALLSFPWRDQGDYGWSISHNCRIRAAGFAWLFFFTTREGSLRRVKLGLAENEGDLKQKYQSWIFFKSGEWLTRWPLRFCITLNLPSYINIICFYSYCYCCCYCCYCYRRLVKKIILFNSLFLTTGRISSSKFEKFVLMKLVTVHGMFMTWQPTLGGVLVSSPSPLPPHHMRSHHTIWFVCLPW